MKTLLILLALTGCTTLAGDPSKMTPEQLKAAAKDKNASVACFSGKTVTGNVTTVYLNADQAANLASKITLGTDCSVVIETASKAASAP